MKLINYVSALCLLSSVAVAGGGLEDEKDDGLKNSPTVNLSADSPVEPEERELSSLEIIQALPRPDYLDLRKRLRRFQEIHRLVDSVTGMASFFGNKSIPEWIKEILPLESYLSRKALYNFYLDLSALYTFDLQMGKALEYAGKLQDIETSWHRSITLSCLGCCGASALSLNKWLGYEEDNYEKPFREFFQSVADSIEKSAENGPRHPQKRRRGNACKPKNQITWSLKEQQAWAHELAIELQALEDLGYEFPNHKAHYERVCERVRNITDLWTRLKAPSVRANEVYNILLAEMRSLNTQALREMAPTMPVVSSQPITFEVTPPKKDVHRIRQQALAKLQEREERLEQARQRKKERRKGLQRDVKEKGSAQDSEVDSVQHEPDVSVYFSGGKEGKFAEWIFTSANEALGNPLQVAAAEMLAVFPQSTGIGELMDNLYTIGMTSNALRLEKIKNPEGWSIRVNEQYRICFDWDGEKGCWKKLWFGDYHTSKKNN